MEIIQIRGSIGEFYDVTNESLNDTIEKLLLLNLILQNIDKTDDKNNCFYYIYIKEHIHENKCALRCQIRFSDKETRHSVFDRLTANRWLKVVEKKANPTHGNVS